MYMNVNADISYSHNSVDSDNLTIILFVCITIRERKCVGGPVSEFVEQIVKSKGHT